MRKRIKKKGNWKRQCGAVLLAAMLVFSQAPYQTVYAETTCSTVTAYPGSTTTAVNVREKAGTKYKSLGVVAMNTPVTILGTCVNGSENWYKVEVKVGGKTQTGYIFASYVKKAGNLTGTVNVTAGSYLNFRQSASTSSACIGKLYRGNQVVVNGMEGAWYKITANINGTNKTGYVSAAYISLTGQTTTSNTTPTSNTNTDTKTYPTALGTAVSQFNETPGVVNEKVTSALNVRYAATTKSSVLLSIPSKTAVTVIGVEGSWYKIKVTYGGKSVTGYVAKEYITLGKSETTPSNPTTPSTPTNTTEQAAYVNSNVTSYLNVRASAGTNGTVLMTIPTKTVLTVIGTSGDWYKVRVTYNGKTVEGYVAKQYVTIGTLTPSNGNNNNNSNNNNTNTPSGTDNVAFETLLSKFPASYQTSLRSLHQTYPKWKFVAVQTNLDWSTVIANESIVGRNVIQSNYPRGTSSLAPFSYLSTASGAYDWSTDKYVVKDGSNWYCANSTVISYYMDPRNFLNSNDIFQYEALSYDSSHKDTVVQSILNNTFMSGNYSVVDKSTGRTVTGSYKQAFMDAGAASNASPYFLATRCKQEVGAYGSGSTKGTYPGYEGYYNFYNIGAFDGGDAVAKGLAWAKTGTSYGKPWTNPYKSIVGGAQYIASNYINKGQNTLYFQKFNVVPSSSSNLYMHQYMTNVQAPYSEGRITKNAYRNYGILKDELVFYIPVYKNMPSTACALPAASGNPNPYLSSVSVTSGNVTYGLTPTFAKPSSSGALSNTNYTIVVPANVSSVNVNATAVSKYTTISGAGTYPLGASGTTKTITITGRAQNGKTQTYTIKVTRK